MIQNNKEFMDFLEGVIEKTISQRLRKENIFVSHFGEITAVSGSTPYSQKCDVDLFYTTLDDVLNKSGEPLNVGDSVMIMERYGSKFSNCYIAAKMGAGV